MLIGMVKDTSVSFIIGLTELFAVVQNLGASSYQYFALYTAAAVLYVAVAFLVDFIFRTVEKTMQTPPTGRLAASPRGDDDAGSRRLPPGLRPVRPASVDQFGRRAITNRERGCCPC